MSTYFIGDIHGCYNNLQTMLDYIHFNPNIDVLHLTGDLVSRGPNSLGVLRLIKTLKNSAHTVLGNHDLHLIKTYFNSNNRRPPNNSFESILKAPDAEELMHWLRQKPILYIDKNKKILMTHAGIHPNWNFNNTKQYAQEIETILKSDNPSLLFEENFANILNLYPTIDITKLKQIQNNNQIFTKMRYIYLNGKLDMQCKNDPKYAPKNIHPWFNLPRSIPPVYSIIFGHWASLKKREVSPNIYGLDSGCCWGGSLTVLRWEDKKIMHISCSPPN